MIGTGPGPELGAGVGGGVASGGVASGGVASGGVAIVERHRIGETLGRRQTRQLTARHRIDQRQ